jgi:hypothetical protein
VILDRFFTKLKSYLPQTKEAKQQEALPGQIKILDKQLQIWQIL